MTNWQLVKNEYETLGTGIKELAICHHTSESLIAAAIKDGEWKQGVEIEDMGTEDLSARLGAMEIKNQAALVPKFIALQTKMLLKCDVLLDSVETLDDAKNLDIVSGVIEKHRPSIMGDKAGKDADNSITVRILTKVGGGADVAVNAVEITNKAGESNGQGVPHGTPIN